MIINIKQICRLLVGLVIIVQVSHYSGASAQDNTADKDADKDLLLPSFFEGIFSEYYTLYERSKHHDFIGFCDEYGLDSINEKNRHAFYEINFYHDLLTGKGASDCVKGGILEIPYFWHWIDPNPRYEILRLPDSIPLKSLKPPNSFASYKSCADIDRVPSLFLSDLVTEAAGYYHPDCGEFYSFGWCSEREMSYCFLMSNYGYQCKIKQSGIHTWSEILVSIEADGDRHVLMSATVDNTFDYVQWNLLDSSIDQKEWLKDYGSGSNITWYNESFRSEEQKKSLCNLRISKKAGDRIRKEVEDALK